MTNKFEVRTGTKVVGTITLVGPLWDADTPVAKRVLATALERANAFDITLEESFESMSNVYLAVVPV